jgi:hypothetical protein
MWFLMCGRSDEDGLGAESLNAHRWNADDLSEIHCARSVRRDWLSAIGRV